MNKCEITVNTFDKLAKQYQDKYMDLDFYTDTYDAFCDLVTDDYVIIFEIACGPGNISIPVIAKRHKISLYHTVKLYVRFQ